MRPGREAESRNGAAGAHSPAAERELMEWIHRTCGKEIQEACGGDAARSALLAAITANESGGCRQAYRFSPENHQRLLGLLAGAEAKVDGLTRAQLEKHLSALRPEAEKTARLKKLAGLHGYTQIAGYFAIVWKAPLDALTEKARHYQLAARRLEQLCREFELDPAQHSVELGRRWNAGQPNARVGPAMYCWRLQERMRLYLEVGGTPGAEATESIA